MKLLIVEDNEDDALLMLKMLGQSGVRAEDVVRVHSITDAISSLRSSSFDVITLDLGLPDSRGTSAIPKILKEASETPIVVVSSSVDPQTILAAVRAGARDYLIKGKFDAPRLAQVLEAVSAWGARLKELKGQSQSNLPASN